MNRSAKYFLAAVGLVAVLVTGSALGMATAGFDTGLATVRIAETAPDGVDLYIPIPAALVDFTLRAGLRLAPAEALADLRREIAPYAPMLEGVAQAIEDSPDTTFVRVVDGSETVQVSKMGRKLVVAIDSPEASIRVSLPASLLSTTLAALPAGGSGSPRLRTSR